MTALLDTNVILRFLTADPSPIYRNLYDFFKSIEIGRRRAEIKLIVLFQVLFVLKSFYQVPKAEICDGLDSLLGFKGLRMPEKKIVRRMLALWREKSIDIVDCYLVACLESDPERVLYSYDKGFDRSGITRREP